MIKKLLTNLNITLDLENVCEIRLRRNRPIKYLVFGKYKTYKKGGVEVIATKELLELAVGLITENSYYAFEEGFANGSLGRFGAKISLGGKGVTEGGKLTAIRDISSLNIRIPRNIDCVSKSLSHDVYGKGKSVLIAGRVCSGKTTFLRALAAKCDEPITVVDEKGELDFGDESLGENADVLAYIPKKTALSLAVKGLSPNYIAFDEVIDFSVVEEAKSYGINVLATTFGEEADVIAKCGKLFDKLIYLEVKDGKFVSKERNLN